MVVSEAGASVYSALQARGGGVPRLRPDAAQRHLDRAPPCRTRSPSSSRSTRRRSASASTSTTCRRRSSARRWAAWVEACVNAVGVDLNTASPAPARKRGRHLERRREKHRRLPAGKRRVHRAHPAQKGAEARAEGLRAVRGLPARAGKPQPARQHPASIRNRTRRRRRCSPPAATRFRRRRPAAFPRCAPRPRRSASRRSPTGSASASRRCATSSPSSRSPAATRATSCRARCCAATSRTSRI